MAIHTRRKMRKKSLSVEKLHPKMLAFGTKLDRTKGGRGRKPKASKRGRRR